VIRQSGKPGGLNPSRSPLQTPHRYHSQSDYQPTNLFALTHLLIKAGPKSSKNKPAIWVKFTDVSQNLFLALRTFAEDFFFRSPRPCWQSQGRHSQGTLHITVHGLNFLHPAPSPGRADKLRKKSDCCIQVDKQEKPKQPKGRAKKRLVYTRRFVNVTLTGGKRKVSILRMIGVKQKKNLTGIGDADEPQPWHLNSRILCDALGMIKGG
jgi:small subunit ribosomal protein S30e